MGDRWSLVVVREVAPGAHRSTDIARGTGAARDRLAARLDDLGAVGVLERRPYSTAPPRSDDHLTRSGRDLLPVLQSLLQWGDRVAYAPPVELHHDGHRAELARTCRVCGRTPHDSPVERVLTDDGRALAEHAEG